MTRTLGDPARRYFDGHARDVTPESEKSACRILYAPVSDQPEIALLCSHILSVQEQKRARCFNQPAEKALFLQRRAFRRFCAALALDSIQPLSTLEFCETENGRPYLSRRPEVFFSFSSCRFGMIGAWSSTHDIGADIEDKTRDPGVADLARQYFSPKEAGTVEAADEPESRQIFFRLWSLKEAALKCIGQGLPFGLDAFEFELNPAPQVIRTPPGFGEPGRYSAGIRETVEHCAAVVIRRRP